MSAIVVNHIEIPVTNMEQAKTFFGDLFNWTDHMQPFSEEYILVYNEGNPLPSYGLYKVDEITKNQVVITMGVEDIDTFMKKAEKAGGKITREKYEISPEIGFGANFEDPFGNSWGLHSSPVK